MRSAYAVEVTPWTTKGAIEAALLFRGTIVSAHGYVETRLAELCFRSSRMPAYTNLASEFPYNLQKRLKYLRSVFSMSPLLPYQALAELFFSKVEDGSDLRHLIAHARMQVLPDWGAVFHDFKQETGKPMGYRQKRMTLSELELAAFRSAKLSRECQRLANGLEELEILPSL